MATSVMSVADLQRLLDTLTERGIETIGPTVRDGAIIYDQITTTQELPIGHQEVQDGGYYRLKATSENSLFAYTMGPQSWKKHLLPSQQHVLTAERQGRGFSVEAAPDEPPARAFLGVRACELAAIRELDKALLKGPHASEPYRKRRENTLIIAVNCTRAGDTCFCTSMGTGPRVQDGFDVLLTEPYKALPSVCLAEAGSLKGRELLDELELAEATEAQLRAADKAVSNAADNMGRQITTEQLPKMLQDSLSDTHWEAIAKRCLNCGNCTMVCPTCFCSTVVDTTDLTGQTAQRIIKWDSCHTLDFSYIHGGSVRTSGMSRYRQWMMHKLSFWTEQFDAFGCVGCGRCIVWCPVGIDITEEAARFRERVSR
ncbi:sulfite reductase subunit A [candidate division GN15 bacterium]|nr:sulfite reductase subunit A [candidate division GN15 bacterium]